MTFLRALGGGELKGDRPVFFAYTDESGTGSIDVEPYAVMASVLVHDSQWRKAEARLAELIDDFVVEEDRDGSFAFHAQSLYSGPKEFRKKYPDWKRNHEFLEKICAIPKDFSLAITASAHLRSKSIARMPNSSLDECTTAALANCSMSCAQSIERFMREHAEEKELVTMIYEDNGKKNKAIRKRHNLFRTTAVSNYLKEHPEVQALTFERIVETAMFAGKEDTKPLQLADACAFIFNRHVRGASIESKFLAPLMSQIMPPPGARLVPDLCS